MTNLDNQQSSSQSVNEWFAGVPGSASPTPPKKRPTRLLVLIILSAILLIASITLALTHRAQPLVTNSTACFDSNKYKDLVTLIQTVDDDQISLSDVQPQELLYTHYVTFIPSITIIDGDASPESEDFLRALGNYGKTKQATAPIVIHINANYTKTDSPTLVKQRMQVLKNVLKTSGFSDAFIVIDDPVLITVDDEADFEERDIISLSIAPSVNCSTQ